MTDRPRTPAPALYRRALAEARPHRRGLALVLLLGFLTTPLALLAPIPLALVLDTVIGGQPLAPPFDALLGADAARSAVLAAAAALSLGAALLALAHRLAEWLVREWVAERMVLEYRTRLLAHGLTLAPGADGRDGAHDVFARVNQDAPALQWTALYGWMPVLWSGAAVAVYVAAVGAIDWTLAGVAVATSVPLVGLVHWTQARLRGAWHAVREAEAGTEAVLMETVHARPVVAAFGREAHAVERFRERAAAALRARLRTLAGEGGLGGLFGVATAVGATLVLVLGVGRVDAGAITAGELVLVLTYAAQLFGPLQQLGTHVTSQQRALVCAERTFSLLDARPPVEEPPVPVPVGRARGHVRLRGVRFARPGGRTILDGLDLDVPAGARVGIVGPSGAGKSTLLALLARDADPIAGAIELDGVDLRRISRADLRRQFAPVPQDAALLSLTLAENVAYGRPYATRGEIAAALAAAGAGDLAARLPQGLDTPLGEAGARLSGGERQRVAIARAFLRDAPVLLMDEPTSAVDPAAEGAILDALDRLAAGRTVFLVTHRPAALRGCHLVLSLDGEGGAAVSPGPAATPRLAEAAE
jgi:ATP-binding cassette subfamily B protein